MKKFLLTLLGVICSLGMWADTLVYDFSTSVGTGLSGDDSNVATASQTINGVSTSVIKLSSSLTSSNNTRYWKITPASGGFKTGDVITWTGCYSNSGVKTTTIWIFDKNDIATAIVTGDNFANVNGGTTASPKELTSGSFTLTSDAEALYIGRTGGTTTFLTQLSVTRPGTQAPSISGSWSKTSDEIVINESAPTLPTFTVSASTGTITEGTDYSVAYSLKEGSTEGIVTVDATSGITAISTSTIGTATVVATITNNTTTYEMPTASYEYSIEIIGAPRSTDAKLSDLKVDGTTIADFDANTKEYTFTVNQDAIAVPEITYTLNDTKATATLSNSSAIPGTTTVKVTAEDGTTTGTYKVNFAYPAFTSDAPKYSISKDQVITKGTAIETGIEGVGLTCGSADDTNDWSGKGKAYNYFGDYFKNVTEGNGNNPTLSSTDPKLPESGTFYKFTTTKAGTINAGIVCNASRDLYVKDGEGNEVYHIKPSVKIYKIISFNVEANKNYYMYAVSTKLGFAGFSFEAAATNPTVNANGYATFSSAKKVKVTGAQVYTAELSGTTITCHKVESNVVPAGTGVLLYSETANAPYTVEETTESVELPANSLKATTLADGSLADTESALVLSGDTFMSYTGSAFVAGKAYFPYSQPAPTAKFSIVFDDDTATAINSVKAATETVAVKKYVKDGRLVIETVNGTYNVAGARVK